MWYRKATGIRGRSGWNRWCHQRCWKRRDFFGVVFDVVPVTKREGWEFFHHPTLRQKNKFVENFKAIGSIGLVYLSSCWLMFMVHLGKYTIHGSYEKGCAFGNENYFAVRNRLYYMYQWICPRIFHPIKKDPRKDNHDGHFANSNKTWPSSILCSTAIMCHGYNTNLQVVVLKKMHLSNRFRLPQIGSNIYIKTKTLKLPSI